MEKNKNIEALTLTEEALRDLELGQLPLSKVLMKTSRLARLLGNTEIMEWLFLEISGYTTTLAGVPPREWLLAKKSFRQYQEKDKNGTIKEYMHCESVGRIEAEIETAKVQLQVCNDPNISVASANPHQTVYSPLGNTFERNTLRAAITKWTSLLDKVRSAVYIYLTNAYYQLKFEDISETIFEKSRNKVNSRLIEKCPSAVKELVSAYENLLSENDSDWSNAGNSCRRVLKDLADTLYPAPTEPTMSSSGHELSEKTPKNRLIEYVASNSSSKIFTSVVGSQLSYLVDRLDALNDFQAKGVHGHLNKEEAERLVIYTYLIVGDILTLVKD